MIPSTLRSAVEGKKTIELGVPRGADVGDVVEVLLRLYPKLAGCMSSDRHPKPQYLNVVAQGPVLYLCGSGARPAGLSPR